MHSFTIKAALAALLISTAFFGAQAAPSNTGPAADGGRGSAAAASNADFGRGDAGRQQASAAMNHNRGDFPNEFPQSQAQGYSTAPAMTGRMQSQRLARIVAELDRAGHRINVDRHRGHLTAAEASKLRHEEGMIRKAAYATAERHGGKLPSAGYDRLQREIHALDRSIHRYARA